MPASRNTSLVYFHGQDGWDLLVPPVRIPFIIWVNETFTQSTGPSPVHRGNGVGAGKCDATLISKRGLGGDDVKGPEMPPGCQHRAERTHSDQRRGGTEDSLGGSFRDSHFQLVVVHDVTLQLLERFLGLLWLPVFHEPKPQGQHGSWKREVGRKRMRARPSASALMGPPPSASSPFFIPLFTPRKISAPACHLLPVILKNQPRRLPSHHLRPR